jgi:formiminotetrahydrofolate cyclodeaminase
MLVDKTVGELLAAFSSPDPTPGGGSAAALASAVGASLLLMVTSLPKTRSGTNEDRAVLAEAAEALVRLRQQLTDAIDADTIAYDQVVAAYRLPKGSDAEKRVRKSAIQRALRSATDVPLGVMRLSAMALKQAELVGAHGHDAASSDVGVAAALLRAGLRGARLNVQINVGSIEDEAYREAVAAEAAAIDQVATNVST